jgi:outer membrane protein assembly factor BamB
VQTVGSRLRTAFARLLLLVPIGVAVLGAAAVGGWLLGTEERPVALRLPKEGGEEVGLEAKAAGRNPGTLIPGPGKPSGLVGSWPQFRGPDRSNVVRDARGLVRSWPAAGPTVLWKVALGEGYAGPVIHRGRVYLMDYDQEKKEDALRCLSLDDGAEIWRYTYSVRVKRNHGMSRTVPAVNDQFVVALGPMCHVTCLDATTGKLAWKLDLRKDYGTEVPPWYAGQCPLIEGGVAQPPPAVGPQARAPVPQVVLAPGGKPLMMAVELATGALRWQTPNPGGWGMTHSSVVPFDFEGGRQYVYCTTKGVVGVAAADGKLLWTKPDWRIGLATVPSPVVIAPDRLFLSGGYKAGCAMVRVKRSGERFETEELFRLGHTVFDAPQHTPIFYEGHLYGVAALGGEDAKCQLACLSLEGKRLWTSGSTNPFGLGSFLLADGLLFVLQGDKGTLHLVEAAPSGYRELVKARVLSGHEAWGPMAMAAGRLLVRDLTQLVCLEVPRSTP